MANKNGNFTVHTCLLCGLEEKFQVLVGEGEDAGEGDTRAEDDRIRTTLLTAFFVGEGEASLSLMLVLLETFCCAAAPSDVILSLLPCSVLVSD